MVVTLASPLLEEEGLQVLSMQQGRLLLAGSLFALHRHGEGAAVPAPGCAIGSAGAIPSALAPGRGAWCMGLRQREAQARAHNRRTEAGARAVRRCQSAGRGAEGTWAAEERGRVSGARTDRSGRGGAEARADRETPAAL